MGYLKDDDLILLEIRVFSGTHLEEHELFPQAWAPRVTFEDLWEV